MIPTNDIEQGFLTVIAVVALVFVAIGLGLGWLVWE